MTSRSVDANDRCPSRKTSLTRPAWHDRAVLLVEVLVIIGVLAAVGVVVAGRGGTMSAVVPDAQDTRVPPRGVVMDPADIDALRFGLAFRGYRMDQVDEALDRLKAELRIRDEKITALTAELAAEGQPSAAPAAAPAAAAVPPAAAAFAPAVL